MTPDEHRRIRKANKRSQKEWADLIGYGRQAVSDWERGANAIPPAVVLIARAVDNDPMMLIRFEQWRGLMPAAAASIPRPDLI